MIKFRPKFYFSGTIKLLEKVVEAKKKAGELILSASKSIFQSDFVERALSVKKNIIDAVVSKGPAVIENVVGVVQVGASISCFIHKDH